MASKLTPSQTVGPFFHDAWRWAAEATKNANGTGSAPVTISGTIRDGDGKPIDDAVIEAWMPDRAGSEAAQALPGFRRVPSDSAGSFRISASLPVGADTGGPVAFITVFARGLVKHQFTAVFLEDDPGLAQSAILKQVPAERRATLIARKQAEGQYQWDIWMQTERETAFFDYV